MYNLSIVIFQNMTISTHFCSILKGISIFCNHKNIIHFAIKEKHCIHKVNLVI